MAQIRALRGAIVCLLLLVTSSDRASAEVRDFCFPGGYCYNYERSWYYNQYNPQTHQYDDLAFCVKFRSAAFPKTYLSPEPRTHRPPTLTAAALQSAVEAAYGTWQATAPACIPAAPVTYNPTDSLGYANAPTITVTFITSNWPFADRADGAMTPEFDLDTGELIQANIWLRATAGWTWTIGGASDPQSVLTHEIGHALGMDHCDVAAACQDEVMYPTWSGVRRTLGAGDAIGSRNFWDCGNAVAGSFLAMGGYLTVSLSWDDDAPGLTSEFEIDRADQCGGPFTPLMILPRTGALHYTVSDWYGLEARTYWYRLVDYNGEQVSRTIPTGFPPPSASNNPRAVVGQLGAHGNLPEFVRLKWEPPVAGGNPTYNVYRSVGGVTGNCGQWLGSTMVTSFVDSQAIAGAMDKYVVTAAYGAFPAIQLGADSVSVCVPARTVVDQAGGLMCPGGDGPGVVLMHTWVYPACGVEPDNPGLRIYAVRVSTGGPGVTLWHPDDGIAYGDTIDATGFDPLNGVAEWRFTRASGCGEAVFAIFADGIKLADSVIVNIRSVDQGAAARGSVDLFDGAALLNAGGGPGCWDLNWSGETDLADFSVVSPHLERRDHIPRRLLAPNGGESFAPGEQMNLAWVRALGDSARVTLRLFNVQSLDTILIASDIQDVGSYSWTVPDTLVANDGYYVELVHTAGVYSADYRDVGTDQSDDFFSILPRRISNLALAVGKTTGALSWTEPGQVDANATQYDIRYSVNTPITDANFYSMTPLSVTVHPGAAGTTHCLDGALTQCRTYYFGIKTKRNWVWSRMSNAATAHTACSGFEGVYCSDQDLVGSWPGQLLRKRRAAPESASAPVAATSDDGIAENENSLLWETSHGQIEDLYHVDGAIEPASGDYPVGLREMGGHTAILDQVSLGAVDHAPELGAFAAESSVLLGTTSPVTGVMDRNGQPLNGLTSALADTPFASERGDLLTVQLSPGAGHNGLVLAVRTLGSQAADDSSGILMLVPGSGGDWQPARIIHPRRRVADAAVDVGNAEQVRLLMMGRYELAGVEQLAIDSEVLPQPLTLTSATHSSLGDVVHAINASGGLKTTLDPGDSLSLTYSGSTVPSGKVRDLFLLTKGSYQIASAIEAGTSPSSVTQSAVTELAFELGPARPNPSSGQVRFSYTLARMSHATLRLYSVTGRLVRTITEGPQEAGPHEAAWDGRDETGVRAPVGVYFYRLEAGGWSSEKKLIVLQR